MSSSYPSSNTVGITPRLQGPRIAERHYSHKHRCGGFCAKNKAYDFDDDEPIRDRSMVRLKPDTTEVEAFSSVADGQATA